MPLDEQRIQRALGQLMNELSPEIRTPNTVIMGLSEFMLIDKTNLLNNKQRELLDTIHQNSVKLQEVIDYLFKVVRVFYWGVVISVEEIDLAQFIPQTIAAARDHWLIHPYSANSSLIEQHLPEKLPHVWMDSQWVQQAIIGIFFEVIRITYAHQEEKILLTVTHNDTSVRFNISTSGEHSSYFYDDSARLFFAQVIAEQHGGEMELRKTDSQLEIILTLPISKNRPVSSQ